jgi:glycosyltransferase involved in cell wall biosynthesis
MSQAEVTLWRVGVIIPVYNEVENIELVLREIKSLPANPAYRLDIVVVDGGSTDGTVEVANQTGVRVVRQRGRGYGAACYTGFEEAASAQILIFLDGDYSDPPAAIPVLLEKMLAEKADLALGSRTLGRFEKGALPLHARLGNRLVVWIINQLYGSRYSDLPSFKAIRREALTSFQMRELTYGWTTEMLVKAARSGCKSVEIPLDYRRRQGGQSKVSGNLKGSLKAAYYLLKTALRYFRWQPLSKTTAASAK